MPCSPPKDCIQTRQTVIFTGRYARLLPVFSSVTLTMNYPYRATAMPNPVGRANVRSCHAGCSAASARAAVAPLTPVAHLCALGVQMLALKAKRDKENDGMYRAILPTQNVSD